jgi:hypothetical protein
MISEGVQKEEKAYENVFKYPQGYLKTSSSSKEEDD